MSDSLENCKKQIFTSFLRAIDPAEMQDRNYVPTQAKLYYDIKNLLNILFPPKASNQVVRHGLKMSLDYVVSVLSFEITKAGTLHKGRLSTRAMEKVLSCKVRQGGRTVVKDNNHIKDLNALSTISNSLSEPDTSYYDSFNYLLLDSKWKRKDPIKFDFSAKRYVKEDHTVIEYVMAEPIEMWWNRYSTNDKDHTDECLVWLWHLLSSNLLLIWYRIHREIDDNLWNYWYRILVTAAACCIVLDAYYRKCTSVSGVKSILSKEFPSDGSTILVNFRALKEETFTQDELIEKEKVEQGITSYQVEETVPSSERLPLSTDVETRRMFITQSCQQNSSLIRDQYHRDMRGQLIMCGVDLNVPVHPYGVSISKKQRTIQMKISGLTGIMKGGQKSLKSFDNKDVINARLEVDAWCIVNRHIRAERNQLNYKYNDVQKEYIRQCRLDLVDKKMREKIITATAVEDALSQEIQVAIRECQQKHPARFPKYDEDHGSILIASDETEALVSQMDGNILDGKTLTAQHGYYGFSKQSKRRLLHREIAHRQYQGFLDIVNRPDIEVDHTEGNRWDNRRSRLLPITKRDNIRKRWMPQFAKMTNESRPISKEYIFSLENSQQLFYLIFMLHYEYPEKLPNDKRPLFEKYMLCWLHSCGFNLPLIGKYLVEHGSAFARLPHRIMFRSEVLPLLRCDQKGNEESIYDGTCYDFYSLQKLHALGLTLFDLKHFFNVDFNIHRMDGDKIECSAVKDFLEVDPTHITDDLWNDLEDDVKKLIETKSDLWEEKKIRSCGILLVQLKFAHGGTVLAAPNGKKERFVIWGNSDHNLQDAFLDREIFPIIDAWNQYRKELQNHNKKHKNHKQEQRLIPETLFQYLEVTVPRDKKRTITDK